MECAMAPVQSSSRGPSLNPPPEAVFWTVAQVCERTQLSRPSVVALITSGQLRARKFGRHWRISAASVRDLSNNTSDAAQFEGGLPATGKDSTR
jgi:excisionase family DNA binding protein